VVDVANRAHVHMRLRPLKLLLCHLALPRAACRGASLLRFR
jgi:hypothetical protein